MRLRSNFGKSKVKMADGCGKSEIALQLVAITSIASVIILMTVSDLFSTFFLSTEFGDSRF